MLASVEQTKRMLRVDDGDGFSDADWQLLIEVASEAVRGYLKATTWANDAGQVLMDLDGSPPVIPQRVVWATIALVGHMYRAPDSNLDGMFLTGELPLPVTALLYPLRDPACS